ncbi:hypothetical protein [Streptomyces sp. NBC_01546]|uniref:hypothetical protein n=1 Tax=Streptomyces sp. NBC_01546 TaxID=2975872 RepID=UPI002F90E9BE
MPRKQSIAAQRARETLRLSVDGSCVMCGDPLTRAFGVWSVPPQFCSAACAPPRPQPEKAADPWMANTDSTT